MRYAIFYSFLRMHCRNDIDIIVKIAVKSKQIVHSFLCFFAFLFCSLMQTSTISLCYNVLINFSNYIIHLSTSVFFLYISEHFLDLGEG